MTPKFQRPKKKKKIKETLEKRYRNPSESLKKRRELTYKFTNEAQLSTNALSHSESYWLAHSKQTRAVHTWHLVSIIIKVRENSITE